MISIFTILKFNLIQFSQIPFPLLRPRFHLPLSLFPNSLTFPLFLAHISLILYSWHYKWKYGVSWFHNSGFHVTVYILKRLSTNLQVILHKINFLLNLRHCPFHCFFVLFWRFLILAEVQQRQLRKANARIYLGFKDNKRRCLPHRFSDKDVKLGNLLLR